MLIEKITDLTVWATLAGAGGLARFLTIRLDPDAQPMAVGNFFFQMLANIFVSGFAGMMGALVMAQITPEGSLQYAAAGVFGFMGVKGLDILSEKMTNKI